MTTNLDLVIDICFKVNILYPLKIKALDTLLLN
jgi:hypothetical protein